MVCRQEAAGAAPMGVDSLKGRQIVGNYELLDKIAEGGMGAIYRGRDQRSGQIVAVKIMPAHMAANPILLQRFKQEFSAASRLDHANIVRALDFGESGNTPFLVMEFVNGESLGQKLEREGKMSEADAIKIIAQVAQGLHRAHKLGMIHRDVKPDNILLTPDGLAKLADLGLVKEAETDLNLTKTGRGLGTPHFMAPEQFRNAKTVDVRSDIYSLGATLYMMVTGELPFRSTGPLDAYMKKVQNDFRPPREYAPSLSERVNWAILRAMSAEAEKRPGSCREFVEDLTGHSTRRTPMVDGSQTADMWFLVYRDDTGVQHTVRGTTQTIRRSLRDGLLGDAANIRCSRAKSGPFEPMRDFPEFRDLILAAASSPPVAPSGTSSRAESVPTIGRTPTKEQPIVAPPPSVERRPPPSPTVPHVRLAPDKPEETGLGWTTWLMLLVIAITSAVLAFLYLPRR